MAVDVVGSKMPSLASEALKPSKAGYGQNGYAGASSDLPGENTQSGFLPGCDLAAALTAVNPKDALDARGRFGKGNPPTPPKGGDTSKFPQNPARQGGHLPAQHGHGSAYSAQQVMATRNQSALARNLDRIRCFHEQNPHSPCSRAHAVATRDYE